MITTAIDTTYRTSAQNETWGGVIFNAAALLPYMQTEQSPQKLNVTATPSLTQAEAFKTASKQEISPELAQMLGVGRNTTNLDIFALFLELMKLDIESQQREKLSRREERSLQLENLDKEVSNYKSQAKMMLFTNIGAGALGILGGMAPILGHTHGDSILSSLSKLTSRFDGVKKSVFFESAAKILNQTKEMQQATGQIHQTKSEADRKRWETFAGNHRTDHEHQSEKVRLYEQNFKAIDQFLIELLRTKHEVAMSSMRGG